jgi:hypothetical protein
MKKNKSLFIILLLLAAATAYFIIKSSDTTVRKELRDFAVKDTASITKIFLADRNGNEVTLERKEKGEWLLNGKDEPKKDQVKFLLDGLYKIDIRSQVAKAAYNNVIKALAASGIKCEIYMKGNNTPFKTYYVGGQTEDALGTFMMIENSSVPFITEIPGFNGYLTPRYSTIADTWKQTRLFRAPLQEIKSVKVYYTNYPEKSFTITSNEGKYSIESPKNMKPVIRVDSVAVENYLSLYANIFFETWAKDVANSKIDSMLKYPPSIIVSLTNTKDATKEVDIYPMPLTSSSLAQQDSLGNPLKYDIDRVYGYVKPNKELVIIQHYTFDKLLRQISDFDAHKPKN